LASGSGSFFKKAWRHTIAWILRPRPHHFLFAGLMLAVATTYLEEAPILANLAHYNQAGMEYLATIRPGVISESYRANLRHDPTQAGRCVYDIFLAEKGEPELEPECHFNRSTPYSWSGSAIAAFYRAVRDNLDNEQGRAFVGLLVAWLVPLGLIAFLGRRLSKGQPTQRDDREVDAGTLAGPGPTDQDSGKAGDNQIFSNRYIAAFVTRLGLIVLALALIALPFALTFVADLLRQFLIGFGHVFGSALGIFALYSAYGAILLKAASMIIATLDMADKITVIAGNAKSRDSGVQ
jgi:hypothetical protein